MVFGSLVLTFDHANAPPRIHLPFGMVTFLTFWITAPRLAIEPLPLSQAALIAVSMTCTAP